MGGCNMKFNEFTEYNKKNVIEENDVVERIEDLLLESVHLSPKEQRDIKSFFDRPRSGEIQLKSYDQDVYPLDEQIVTVTWRSGKLIFDLPIDFFEVVGFIIDTCDDYGYDFKEDYEKPINQVTITVMIGK